MHVNKSRWNVLNHDLTALFQYKPHANKACTSYGRSSAANNGPGAAQIGAILIFVRIFCLFTFLVACFFPLSLLDG